MLHIRLSHALMFLQCTVSLDLVNHLLHPNTPIWLRSGRLDQRGLHVVRRDCNARCMHLSPVELIRSALLVGASVFAVFQGSLKPLVAVSRIASGAALL
jgi:hypothetical protein